MSVSARTCAGRGSLAAVILLALIVGMPNLTDAELRSETLSRPRTIIGSQWLDLHLRLLGLELTYPAYRVHIGLSEQKTQIVFDFWISAPLARHLEDAGRSETKRVLSYHAAGIRDQLRDMLDQHFADLAAQFDAETDLTGTFYTPASDVKAPPVELAQWAENEFSWPTGP